jgi:hypothetical protein
MVCLHIAHTAVGGSGATWDGESFLEQNSKIESENLQF